MSMYNISIDSIDANKENDIDTLLHDLSEHGQLNNFVESAIRYVLQEPEAFKKFTKEQLDSYGLEYNRAKFFKDVVKQINKMKDKVNNIHNMAFRMYSLAQMNKRLGLEGKANNLEISSILLNKQIKDLESIIGEPLANIDSNDEMLRSMHTNADDILEFILETYDGLFTGISVVENNNLISVDNTKSDINNTVENTVNTSGEVEEQGVDEVNFDNADISALERFLSGGE